LKDIYLNSFNVKVREDGRGRIITIGWTNKRDYEIIREEGKRET
jgi:hypothetical protein